MKLTEAQLEMLHRLAAGDKFRARCNFMFCQDERSKWVSVWESDKTVAPEATSTALLRKGYLYAGAITDAGRRALAADSGEETE